jgi:hypothetical protein
VGKFGYELWGKMPRKPLSNLTEGTVGEYSLRKTGQFSLARLANCLRGQFDLGMVGQFELDYGAIWLGGLCGNITYG